MIFQYATQTSEKIYLTKNETKIEIIKVSLKFCAENRSLWIPQYVYNLKPHLSVYGNDDRLDAISSLDPRRSGKRM